MSPENDAILCSRYPSLYRDRHGDPKETAFFFGFEVGDGWFGLIDAISKLVTERAQEVGLDPVVSQIKEKYGTLRFNVFGLDGDEYARGIIRMGGLLSGRICQACGATGTLFTHGWWRVHCDQHEKDYRAGLSLKSIPNGHENSHMCLATSDAATVLHRAIACEVKFNDLPEINIEIEASEEGGLIKLESPESCLRVAGMLAMLEKFSLIRVVTAGEAND